MGRRRVGAAVDHLPSQCGAVQGRSQRRSQLGSVTRGLGHTPFEAHCWVCRRRRWHALSQEINGGSFFGGLAWCSTLAHHGTSTSTTAGISTAHTRLVKPRSKTIHCQIAATRPVDSKCAARMPSQRGAAVPQTVSCMSRWACWRACGDERTKPWCGRAAEPQRLGGWHVGQGHVARALACDTRGHGGHSGIRGFGGMPERRHARRSTPAPFALGR